MSTTETKLERSLAMEAQEHSPMTPRGLRQAVPAHLRTRTNALRLSLVALLLVAMILLGVLLILRVHGTSKTTLPPVGAPASVSASQLKELATQSDLPVYWAGSKQGAYELTRTADGRVYIRYLPSADKVGDQAPDYLTIGTYPTKEAFSAIKRAATRQGGVSVNIEHGGLLVFNDKTPKSVYFSYPKSGYQVEVYDPSPLEARALVLDGSIKPIH
jgi:hypothetical protein